MYVEEKGGSIFDRALSSLMKWKIKDNSLKKKKTKSHHCLSQKLFIKRKKKKI